jgi:hypothetical protein
MKLNTIISFLSKNDDLLIQVCNDRILVNLGNLINYWVHLPTPVVFNVIESTQTRI